jgi:hypothetical protein
MAGLDGVTTVLVLGGVGLLVLVLLAVGVLLLVTRKTWPGVIALAIAILLVPAVFVWSRLDHDPDTLRLDLRAPIPQSSVGNGDRGMVRGFETYDSEVIELTLPDGTAFATSVNSLSLLYEGGVVTGISLSRKDTPWASVDPILTSWAGSLGLTLHGLDGPSEWKQEDSAHGVQVQLSRTPLNDDDPPAEGRASMYLSQWTAP